MQTSTPLIRSPRSSLRKSVLLRDIQKGPSPRRRLSNIINQSPVVQMPIDDDLERSSRRNEADIQRRVSSISSPQAVQPCNEKEVRDHFQICLKMYAENKISAKNAWNLKMIDYMRIVLQSKGLAKDSLQVAGTSLDVSAKIYGIRVDDIHSDGLKLASNMARVNSQQEAEGAEEGEGENGEADADKENDGQKKKKKPKHRLVGKKTTVAKDPGSLLSDIVKLESVFFQTRTNLELSSVDNLFTNKMPLNHGGYKFMLLSKQKAWPSYAENDPVISEEKSYLFKVSEVTALEICAPFADFEIDEWDPEQEAQMLPTDKPVLAEEVVYDEQGIPMPELDGSVHDLFANADAENQYATSDEDEGNGLAQAAIQTNTVAHIVDFKPEGNNVGPDEYCYSSIVNIMGNKRITQVWAGPSHWKLKHIRRIISRFSGQPEKQTGKSVKKTRIQPMLIDFSEDVPYFDTTKIAKVKRCRIDEDPYKCTLPEVFHIEKNLYRSLMLKPVYISSSKKNNEENVIDPEVRPYNYDNLNDSQYCPQNGMMDDDDNVPPDDGDFQNDDEVAIAHQQDFLGENLVEAPELVPKAYIPYALQAKKMDMKKLKTAVWKSLVSEYPNDMILDEDMYKKDVLPTTFSAMYKQLPQRITEKMRQELSCPLAFVALLHLANEQNLKFAGQPDLKDFSIERAKKFTM